MGKSSSNNTGIWESNREGHLRELKRAARLGEYVGDMRDKWHDNDNHQSKTGILGKGDGKIKIHKRPYKGIYISCFSTVAANAHQKSVGDDRGNGHASIQTPSNWGSTGVGHQTGRGATDGGGRDGSAGWRHTHLIFPARSFYSPVSILPLMPTFDSTPRHALVHNSPSLPTYTPVHTGLHTPPSPGGRDRPHPLPSPF